MLMLTACMVLNACYKKFDPDSYAPPFTISGFTAVKEIQPSSLVAYWGFNGDLKDSVSGTAGTNNKTTFTGGFIGQGLSLNVANKSYVTTTPGTTITGAKSFTVSFWVNPTFVDANSDSKTDGTLGLFALANSSTFWGNLEFFIEGNQTTATPLTKIHIGNGAKDTWIEYNQTSPFGVWFNHTLTYDAATSKFIYYVNGSPVKTVTAGWTGDNTWTSSGPIIFGTDQFQTTPPNGTSTGETWASYLTGTLDEVRIYNKALTATEVNAMTVLQGKGK